MAGAALVAAIPGTGVVFTAEALFRPGYAVGSALPTIYLAVAVLMLAIGSLVITVLAGRRNLPKTDDVTGGETGAGRTARFLDRLPPELGRDLVCLRMADHYVEVFTTSGSTLILMRFADAVAELESAGGLRVHRLLLGGPRSCNRSGKAQRPNDAPPDWRPRGARQPGPPRRCPRGRSGVTAAGLPAAGWSTRRLGIRSSCAGLEVCRSFPALPPITNLHALGV